ncbi:MAG: HAMP domain-containing histidine kinase, partial [Ktedonobacteraceae bacterium]|nr:HAMP domain-containing histidine kinase [Ktedonobacteraceae bacterium]
AVLLSTVALDYFFLPPFQSAFVAWKNTPQILPFFLVAVVIAIITAQREAARQRAFYAEQDLQAYAEELEEANQKLEQASRMKDNFLSRASHELKTPLTVIRGQAQLALRRLPRAALPDQELIRTALERIEAQTHRLHGLIDDLLDISLLNSGKLRLRPQACNLGELCRDVVENHHLLTERDIRLELPPTPLMIQADSERMTQVLVNLVNNAVKYSPPESSVFVRVTQEADKVLISVHNEGPPIPQEQQANIFMPFYRTSDAQSSAQKGWGLGLAISKEIVEQHGGQIRVESGTDKGTTFFVSLPYNINTR